MAARRLALMCALAVGVGTFTPVGGAGASGTPDASADISTERPIVYMYGDSLARESASYWTYFAASRGYDARPRTYGGTAPCDYLPKLRSDMLEHAAKYVVVAFTGNNLLPCMSDEHGLPLTGDAYYEAYREDLTSYARIATRAGSAIILVGPPESRGGDSGPMNSVYQAVADSFEGASYLYGGTLVTPKHVFRATAPCLPFETAAAGCGVNLRIKIRNSDGRHLCPAAFTPAATCPTYSGGALRYAATLASLLPSTSRAA